MKIAVLSDIHGNLNAIKEVIKDIENENISKIYICGDLVMAGPEVKETLDYIRKIQQEKNIIIIKGNTDEMIAENILPPNEIMAESVKYAQSVLTENDKEYLKSLPLTHKETIGNLSLLFVHGSPRKIDENISPDLTVDEVKILMGDVQENVIFCGHTHLPVVYNIEEQIVINVGSVGRPFAGKPWAFYTIIELIDSSQKNFAITQKEVPYHFLDSSNKLKALPFIGADILGEMLKQATGKFPE